MAVMYGNGVLTGTVLTIMKSLQKRVGKKSRGTIISL